MRSRTPHMLTTAVVTMLAQTALATDPPVLLNDDAFDYNADGYIGPNFGFATQLSQTTLLGSDFDEVTTGVFGNVVPLNRIGDGSQFNNGVPVPLAGQNAADLPNVFNSANLGSLFGSVEFSGQGDTRGFTSFTATHRSAASVTSNQLTSLENARADTFSQAIFQVEGDDLRNLIRLTIIADALLGIDSTGAASNGIDVQLINVTDPNNQFLVEELSGFFFQDENLLIPSFLDRTGNEVGSFTNTFDFQNNSFLNEFEVTFDMELDVGETYALNIVSDVAASLNGEGAAFIDSSNSLNVSLSAVEPNTRLVVPAPSSLALLGIASLLCRRRR